ncbi:hypothetical protein MLD38_021737 [Melastoma candidum]|uniref:Uncharacterized protein n=1 Tax=Melastoma candidum TaxID=119954 RepID=A0ACB9QKW4_9MYRT|nr:hypothetical protein MLD38_021737 [Melastoma candidum]
MEQSSGAESSRSVLFSSPRLLDNQQVDTSSRRRWLRCGEATTVLISRVLLASAGKQEYAETWEDEEDRYLAEAVLEQMQLNEEQVSKRTWYPICKKGQMQENNSIIFCSSCELKLKRSDEVNLDMLRLRLAEAHADQLDRGCRSKPTFSVETILDFTALYITCPSCDTFDIVIELLHNG